MSETSYREALAPASAIAPAPRADATRQTGARAPRGLMLCSLFTLAYRALRCFTAAGIEMHALGNTASRGMRHSRPCASYTETACTFDGGSDCVMIATVNALIAQLGIDFVVAGDQPATRSLITMRAHLHAPCFPMPDLATYDKLNDKARFTDLCRSLDITVPPTSRFADRAELLEHLAAGTVSLPAVIKPLALDGNRGVTIVTSAAELRAARIDFQPVLVQDFIPGIDIGASVLATSGRITAYICHQLRRATYTVLDQPTVLAALTDIVRATKASGILNFDMRLAPDGTVYFLECNPRVFYKMNLSMLTGLNFASLGLGASGTPLATPKPGTATRSPKAILATLPTPWRLTRHDAAMLGYLLADPMPYLREKLRLDWEDRSY